MCCVGEETELMSMDGLNFGLYPLHPISISPGIFFLQWGGTNPSYPQPQIFFCMAVPIPAHLLFDGGVCC
jgi:hypothetical protein